MKVFKTNGGPVVQFQQQIFSVPELAWDELINRHNAQSIEQLLQHQTPVQDDAILQDQLQPPIGTQEVWAAGVTYFRSRDARMEEADEAGGGDFYDRVYRAPRPELFFKATPNRVVGPGQQVRVRDDSSWTVPEPELTLVVNRDGKIVGYTIGNDMSSRDIEGENPLYLPQAKTYDRSCGLGPCILLTEQPLPATTEIRLQVLRRGTCIVDQSTQLSEMKRKPEELVGYLFRNNSFPNGCFLMTGTGIVPASDFTLESKDEIRITIEPVGTLVNLVQ